MFQTVQKSSGKVDEKWRDKNTRPRNEIRNARKSNIVCVCVCVCLCVSVCAWVWSASFSSFFLRAHGDTDVLGQESATPFNVCVCVCGALRVLQLSYSMCWIIKSGLELHELFESSLFCLTERISDTEGECTSSVYIKLYSQLAVNVVTVYNMSSLAVFQFLQSIICWKTHPYGQWHLLFISSL